ncbi:hypothetical protein QUB00_26925 [Microcoleus sp. F8_C2]
MTDKNLPLGSHYQSDPYQASTLQLAVELKIAEERLRQARYSFNLAFILTATSALIGFAGVGLVVLGKAPEGTITMTGGLASSAYCLQLAKDTNDRLNKQEDDS